MISAPLPKNENQRLETIERLSVIYAPAEQRFDRLTKMACRMFEAPMSMVSIVGETCQWFKSVQGSTSRQTPRSIAFCAWAILEPEMLVVEDATLDERFHDNPLVTTDPKIRFYAGVPLHGPDGHVLGSFCIVDRVPRTFSAADRETLRDLACMVEQELAKTELSLAQTSMLRELSGVVRESMIDPATGLWNQRGFTELLRREVESARRSEAALSVLSLGFGPGCLESEPSSRLVTERAMQAVAERMRAALRPFDTIARTTPQAFAAVLPGCDERSLTRVHDTLRAIAETVLREFDPQSSGTTPVFVGGASIAAGEAPEALLDRATAALTRNCARVQQIAGGAPAQSAAAGAANAVAPTASQQTPPPNGARSSAALSVATQA